MNISDVIALILMSVLIITITAFIILRKVIFTKWWVAAAIIVLILLTGGFPTYPTDTSLYITVALILCPILLCFIKCKQPVKIIIVLLCTLLSYSALTMYANLYQFDFTTSPYKIFNNIQYKRSKNIIKLFDYINKKQENNSAIYAMGRVKDSTLVNDMPLLDRKRLLTSEDYTFTRCWHTSITGIYKYQTKTVELWHGGGSIKDFKESLRYR